ncbi:MAG: lysophospholipid acyltransferase family protein [Spirochaetia bacterium]
MLFVMVRLLGWCVGNAMIAVYRLLGSSITIVNNPLHEIDAYHRQGRRVVFAIWHEFSVIGIYWYRRRGAAALVDDSFRGDVLAMVLNHFGIRDFRIKSAQAPPKRTGGIPGFIRYLNEGHDGLIAIDGPFGPARLGKPGILQIAARTGHVIVPLGAYFSHAIKVRRRWDNYQIPLPFSRLHITLGEPIEVPRNYKMYQATLLEQLNAATNAVTTGSTRTGRTFRRT